MKNKFLHVLKYVFFDISSAALAWIMFMIYRTSYLENEALITNSNFYINLSIITVCWIALYSLMGSYKDIYRKSRLGEVFEILYVSAIGVVIIFFAVLLDDFMINYKQYYSSFLALFCFHFLLTAIFRFILTTLTAYRIHNKIIGFNTLIIGSNEKAALLFNDLKNEYQSSGHSIIGFLSVDKKDNYLLSKQTKHLGDYTDLKQVIENNDIEDIIIAIESSEHNKIETILNELENTKVFIKIIPDMYDILSGSVKMNSILGTPLIEIKHNLLPEWERISKSLFDLSISLVSIILFMPIYILTAILVKLSSSGPILYKQERIGLNGKPFYIYKFRSMYVDAEKDGPQLSSKTDRRITKWGRLMRRSRLDETPQFFNILKGDMSFVGPRPERAYFANQLIEKAPHYKHIYKVKPGLTSWGMVKYGYAENLEEMMDRMKYDILYIENMSLLIDLKIMIYTILIILEGRGR